MIAICGFVFEMKLITFIILTVLLCQSVAAAEKKLDGAAIAVALDNVTLTSTENDRKIEQVFQSSGATFTIDVQTKALSQGFWRVEGDKYCSQWPPSEHWSCYDMFTNQAGVVFVSSNGTRYQMATPLAD